MYGKEILVQLSSLSNRICACAFVVWPSTNKLSDAKSALYQGEVIFALALPENWVALLV